MEKCKSGRPLRRQFSGLFYLPSERYRVIDLEAKQDRILTEAQVKKSLGEAKWGRVLANMTINGFHESGRYRIEMYD